MSCHGNNGHSLQTGHLLNLFGQGAYDGCRMGHLSKLLSLQSKAFYEIVVEVACHRVEDLRGGSHGVFTDGIACKHIAQRVGDEEYLVGILERHVASLAHGIKLEKRVEVHKLYARLLVYLFLAYLLVEVFLHHAHGVWVAVSQWIAQYGSVLGHVNEVASPGVDTDALYVDAALRHQFQTFDDFLIQGIDVPVVVSACLYQVVVEACQFFETELTFRQRTDDGSSAGSTEVYRKIVFFVVHSIRSLDFLCCLRLQR